MEVNNEIYETLGHLWWSDDAGFDFTSLRYGVNPLRYSYFERQLAQLGAPGKAILDVGCGGGFLAEEFARHGYHVTGIDPADSSVEAAREHAAANGLPIRYEVGRGESLPFLDCSFDIIACCDVLEHVDDPNQVIHEVSRTLRTGGLFLYDTVNRTVKSKIVLIKVWQDWNIVGSGHPNGHVWEKFIKPHELAAMMRSAGLFPGETRGMSPRKNPAALLYALWRIRTRRIRGEAIAREFALRETDDLSVSYMGWARKGAPLEALR